jgi:hypothetical protein
MPHHPIPPDAPKLPQDPATGATLVPRRAEAKAYSWATVSGASTGRIQDQEGMGKGQPHYRIDALCPKCEDEVVFYTTLEHGEHYVTCHCSIERLFTVAW